MNYPDMNPPTCYRCEKIISIELGSDTDQVCYDDLNNLVWECDDCHRKHRNR